jgi:hypothetical protein
VTDNIDKEDHRLSSNSNLNLNTSLNIDNDLLNSLRGGMKIDQPLTARVELALHLKLTFKNDKKNYGGPYWMRISNLSVII